MTLLEHRAIRCNCIHGDRRNTDNRYKCIVAGLSKKNTVSTMYVAAENNEEGRDQVSDGDQQAAAPPQICTQGHKELRYVRPSVDIFIIVMREIQQMRLTGSTDISKQVNGSLRHWRALYKG